MKSFKFTYGFVDENNIFQPQESGQVVFTKIVLANYNTEALDKLVRGTKGNGTIEILDFEEVEV